MTCQHAPPVDGTTEAIGEHHEQGTYRGEQEHRRHRELDDVRDVGEGAGGEHGGKFAVDLKMRKTGLIKIVVYARMASSFSHKRRSARTDLPSVQVLQNLRAARVNLSFCTDTHHPYKKRGSKRPFRNSPNSLLACSPANTPARAT